MLGKGFALSNHHASIISLQFLRAEVSAYIEQNAVRGGDDPMARSLGSRFRITSRFPALYCLFCYMFCFLLVVLCALSIPFWIYIPGRSLVCPTLFVSPGSAATLPLFY